MALLDKVVKQRMVGALVLVAMAVIFLPMLFTREDELRQVQVEAPAAPAVPALPQVQVEPVAVPEPQVIPDETLAAQPPSAPSTPIAPAPAPVVEPTPAPAPAAAPAQPATPAPASKPVATPPKAVAMAPAKVDGNGLPVSWSVQLASLSNRANAENLQKTLRSQGYNAYIRAADGTNRVFVGPLIERAEAERLRDVINRQQKLKGFVVRFQPERS